jgi:hypothetical protein
MGTSVSPCRFPRVVLLHENIRVREPQPPSADLALTRAIPTAPASPCRPRAKCLLHVARQVTGCHVIQERIVGNACRCRGGQYLLEPSPSTIRNTRFGGDVPRSGNNCRPTSQPVYRFARVNNPSNRLLSRIEVLARFDPSVGVGPHRYGRPCLRHQPNRCRRRPPRRPGARPAWPGGAARTPPPGRPLASSAPSRRGTLREWRAIPA